VWFLLLLRCRVEQQDARSPPVERAPTILNVSATGASTVIVAAGNIEGDAVASGSSDRPGRRTTKKTAAAGCTV
jgi:hypothetical protein